MHLPDSCSNPFCKVCVCVRVHTYSLSVDVYVLHLNAMCKMWPHIVQDGVNQKNQYHGILKKRGCITVFFCMCLFYGFMVAYYTGKSKWNLYI